MSAHNDCFDGQLLDCIKEKRNAEVLLMLNQQLVESHDGSGTLLHYAAMWGNDFIVQRLIDLGADIDYLIEGMPCNSTPLMLAIAEQHIEVVNLLLEANANIDIVNTDGESAILMALEPDGIDFSITEALVSRLKREYSTHEALAQRLIAGGCTMRHAVYLRDIKLLDCMLNMYNIDVNSQDAEGTTALHTAAELSDFNAIKWLIENAADVNAGTNSGATPILESACRRSESIMKLLLEHGADPNCYDTVTDYTPLLAVLAWERRSCDEESIECIELLLQHGAIPQNPNRHPVNLLDCVLEWSNDHVNKMFVGHLALLETMGVSVKKSILFCKEERNNVELPELEHYFEMCQQELQLAVFRKCSLFDLLHGNEQTMRLLVRNESFVSKVERFCSEMKLNDSYSFYYKILMRRVEKACRVINLEEKAIPLVSNIFNSNYNLCYYSARQITSYLNEHDLKCFIQI